MFDDFNRICCRSWNSAGKVTIKTPYFGRSINSGKIPEVPIFSDDEGSQKGESRWATMAPDATQARGPVWPRLGRVWRPWPASDGSLSRISSPRETYVGGIAQRNIRRL